MKFTPPPLTATVDQHDDFIAVLEDASNWDADTDPSEIEAWLRSARRRRALAVSIRVSQNGNVRLEVDGPEPADGEGEDAS